MPIETEQLRRAPYAREQDAEPVAWQSPDGSIREDEGQGEPPFDDWKPLYASPPKRKRLTDEQIGVIVNSMAAHDAFTFTRAVEMAHGIGDE